MTAKKVSVIVLCDNSERDLAETIESVLHQSYPAFEILVVDNGSTDGSRTIIDRYFRQYFQVQSLLLPRHAGLARARNRGIAHSSGEYIVILDSGDRLLPHGIEAGVNALNAHPDWMFAFGPCRRIQESGQSVQPGRSVLEQPIVGSVYRTLLQGTCLNPFGRHLFRRILFDLIGDFDTRLQIADDYDFYLRAAARFRCGSYGQTAVEYRSPGSTLSEPAWTAKYFREVLTVYAKQQPCASKNPDTAAAHQEGLRHWRRLYRSNLFSKITQALQQGQLRAAGTTLHQVLRHYPQELLIRTATQASSLIKSLQPLTTTELEHYLEH